MRRTEEERSGATTPHHLQADDRRVVRQVKEMEGSREKEKGEGRGEKGGAVVGGCWWWWLGGLTGSL